MARRKATARKKRALRPSEHTVYGTLKPQLDLFKELLFGFFSTIQTLRPIYRGKASPLGLFLHLQRIKGELKREVDADIRNLEVELARLEERVYALQNELDLAQRISRLEEKYDFLIEEQLNPEFSLTPLGDDEGYEDLPKPTERNRSRGRG